MPPRTPTTHQKPRRLPDGDLGYVRLPLILELYPVGESSWWRGVATGKYPQPVKLSARCTAWRLSEIRALLSNLNGGTDGEAA